MGRCLFVSTAILFLSSCHSSPECTGWERVDFGIDEFFDLSCIRGVSSTDFWIAGVEILLRCDGNTCTSVDIAETGGFDNLWVSSAESVWFSSFSYSTEELVHWNGSIFETIPVDIPLEGYLRITGLWGSGSNSLWLVGHDLDKDSNYNILSSIIMHWNGQEWSRLENTPDIFLGAIWGFSDNDIWVVGSEGTIVHWDGVALNSYSGITDEAILGIWGYESDDVWTVGDDGIILHWDGNEWSEAYDLGANRYLQLQDVWGISSDDIWASGSLFVNFNDTEVKHYGGEGCGVLCSIWGAEPENLWAVGSQGKVLKRK